MTKTVIGLLVAGVLAASGIAFSGAPGDFEVTGPDGRPIQLKGDGTWRYLEAKDKEAPSEKSKDEGELTLLLERKIERAQGCRFAVRLSNDLTYEVRNLVLYYSAYRANGVIYDTVSAGSAFGSLKPGDRQFREFEFVGLPCSEIVRVQVVGGDRCTMGELHRWSDQTEYKGKCLARVRVAESAIVRFDK